MSAWTQNRIFDRYIDALVSLKKSDSSLKTWHQNALTLLDVFKNTPQLTAAIENPTVGSSSKQAVISDLGKSLKLDKTFTQTLLVFVQQGRATMMSHFLERMVKQLKKEMGIVSAYVTAAEELTAAQQKDIAATFGKDVEITTDIKPEILGGLIIQVGSWRMDDSIKGKIDRLTRKLNKAA